MVILPDFLPVQRSSKSYSVNGEKNTVTPEVTFSKWKAVIFCFIIHFSLVSANTTAISQAVSIISKIKGYWNRVNRYRGLTSSAAVM